MLPLASNSTFFSCNPRDFLLVYVNDSNQAMTLTKNSSYFFFRVFQWKPSLNGLTTIFTVALSRCFLEYLKHYPVPISSRAFHALYTIPWRSRLTKTNAPPTQTMSVTIHEKRLFPSLIFWHLYASTFFLFQSLLIFFCKHSCKTTPDWFIHYFLLFITLLLCCFCNLFFHIFCFQIFKGVQG